MSELRKNAFSSEEEFEEIYEKSLENKPMVSCGVQDNYEGMHRMFEDYLASVQEDMFRYAYQCGYEAALKGGAAV